MGTHFSTWNPGLQLLHTTLSGEVTAAEVVAWRDGLHALVDALPAGTSFKLLMDLHGYEPGELAAHREMRLVIPSLLARHGLRPAVVDLFDDAEEPVVVAERDVVCRAFANVHHDAEKMARYQAEAGKPNQKFFSDRAIAEAWLTAIA